MSRFTPSIETKREIKTAVLSLALLAVTPSLIANTTHGFIKPLHTLFWFHILVYCAYLSITAISLLYLRFKKSWSFGPPLILIGSVGIWLWGPLYIPYNTPSYFDFWFLDRLNGYINGDFNLMAIRPHEYAAIFTAIAMFFHFAIGVRLIVRGKDVIRARTGAERYRSKETVFGDARWGRWKTIKNIVAPKDKSLGIIVGEDYDPLQSAKKFDFEDDTTWGPKKRPELIHFSDRFISGHSLFVCGSGGGKTTAYVIPNCLNYKQGIVVSDPIGDVFLLTQGQRRSFDRKPVELNLLKGMDFFSVLKPVLSKGVEAYSDLADVFVMADSKESFDEHYIRLVRPIMSSVIRYLLEEKHSKSPLKELHSIFGHGRDNATKLIGKLAKNTSNKYYKDEFNKFISRGSDEMMWMFSFLDKSLAWMNTPEVLHAYSADDETNLKEITDVTDVYITIPSESLRKTFKPLYRAILVALLLHFQITKNKRGKRLVIIDEAATLGYLEMLSNMRDTSRQNHIHLMMIYQNFKQITDAFGYGAAEEWISSMACFGLSGISGKEETKQVSEMVGTYTARVEDQSTSSNVQGTGVTPSTFGSSKREAVQRANLIESYEVSQLPLDSQIIYFRGQEPMLCGKAFNFRRPEWKAIIDPVMNVFEKERRRAQMTPQERAEDELMEGIFDDIDHKITPGRTRREIKAWWQNRKTKWDQFREAEKTGIENKIRNALTLKPKYDRKKLIQLVAQEGSIRRMSFEEIREAQIKQHKEFVYNEANWGIRRFLEQGLNYKLAMECDRRFHPNRCRVLDDMLYCMTRKEYREWIKRQRNVFPGLAQKADELHAKKATQTDAEFYDYQELHPDDYKLPRHLKGSFVPKIYHWGTNYVGKPPLLHTRFCDCAIKEPCKCGMRNHPARFFGTIHLKTKRGLKWAHPERFLPLSDSKALRHTDRTEPYEALPPPYKYDQRKGPAPLPYFDETIKVDWQGQDVGQHTREFKSAIPKVDIDGINDEIDKKVDVIANHDHDLFSAAEDLHGDGRRQDEIESNDHPTHETVEAQSDQELDNADELMDIDKQIEELMKKRKDLE